jgi:DNA repair protein RadC
MSKVKKKPSLPRRQSLRNQILSHPENQLSDESILETLLSYSIPIGDLQNLVKTLLKKYKNLDGVLNADYHDLCKIKGLKENTAALLKLAAHIKKYQVVQDPKQPIQETRPDAQQRLYEESQEQMPPQVSGVAEKLRTYQKESLFFSKALLKDTIQVLPTLPDFDNLEDLRQYLLDNLKYGSSSRRKRYSLYIIRRMFPDGSIDNSLLEFSRKYPNSQVLNDVAFYRFCKAEPIMIQIISDLLLPMTGAGTLQRIHVTRYLNERYPSIKGIKDWSIAIIEALNGAKIVAADAKKITLTVRQPLIPSFAYILHCEYPKPGVYPIESLEKNPYLKSMFWTEDSLVPSLYELRNMGLITRVSEIDTIRQFTTKYSPSDLVSHLSGVQ